MAAMSMFVYVSVIPERRHLMPSSWSCFLIMPQNPTTRRSTGLAGQNEFLPPMFLLRTSPLSLWLPGQVLKVLQVQMSVPPVEPVMVASEPCSQTSVVGACVHQHQPTFKSLCPDAG